MKRAVGLYTVASSSSSSALQTFKGASGTICSPNYPQNYYNNEYKQYKIIAPSLSKIVLTFTDFDIEYDFSCSYDSLKASDHDCCFARHYHMV